MEAGGLRTGRYIVLYGMSERSFCGIYDTKL